MSRTNRVRLHVDHETWSTMREVDMRKRIAVATVAVLATMTLAMGASAHSAPPCNDSGDPGHSDYAQHHIVVLAKAGSLGHGGHIPGDHQGYSGCL
jgi:hypothetical protein